MNREDLARVVYEAHGGISFADAQKIVDLILETIKGRLVGGEKVLLSGFGCFRVVTRKERKGVNPQTGAPVTISARKAVVFKPSGKVRGLE